mmetsp:Transcript_9535/g.14695  ORF Transcript_9535/g.14695 Transcript_9535/m.14695 type:complete len:95 (+) Transcript_9535:136-420(+)
MHICGVVRESFRSNDAPVYLAVMGSFAGAWTLGVVVGMVSGCRQGPVMSTTYSAGVALRCVGGTRGLDLTVGAMFAKLRSLPANDQRLTTLRAH